MSELSEIRMHLEMGDPSARYAAQLTTEQIEMLASGGSVEICLYVAPRCWIKVTINGDMERRTTRSFTQGSRVSGYRADGLAPSLVCFLTYTYTRKVEP